MEYQNQKTEHKKNNKEETISMDFTAPDWTNGIWVQTKSLKYTCTLILCFDRALPVERKQMKPKQIISDKKRERKKKQEKCAVRTKVMIIFLLHLSLLVFFVRIICTSVRSMRDGDGKSGRAKKTMATKRHRKEQ